jgi:hypothetical protein
MIKDGNAAMLADIQLALLNKPLDPKTLLGSPQVTMGSVTDYRRSKKTNPPVIRR